MFLDLLVTVLASVVIGWNVGSWLVPSSWIAVVCLAALSMHMHWLVLFGSLRGNRAEMAKRSARRFLQYRQATD
jgi:hypothetical protein